MPVFLSKEAKVDGVFLKKEKWGLVKVQPYEEGVVEVKRKWEETFWKCASHRLCRASHAVLLSLSYKDLLIASSATAMFWTTMVICCGRTPGLITVFAPADNLDKANGREKRLALRGGWSWERSPCFPHHAVQDRTPRGQGLSSLCSLQPDEWSSGTTSLPWACKFGFLVHKRKSYTSEINNLNKKKKNPTLRCDVNEKAPLTFEGKGLKHLRAGKRQTAGIPCSTGESSQSLRLLFLISAAMSQDLGTCWRPHAPRSNACLHRGEVLGRYTDDSVFENPPKARYVSWLSCECACTTAEFQQ